MRLRRWPTASAILLLLLLGLVIVRIAANNAASDPDVVFSNQPHTLERVVDGQTLQLTGGRRVSLLGVAPFSDDSDEDSKQFLHSLIEDHAVRLEFDRQRLDVDHTLLAYVILDDGRLLNAEIIHAGFGRVSAQHSVRSDRLKQFREAENDAKSAHRGLWGRVSRVSPQK